MSKKIVVILLVMV